MSCLFLLASTCVFLIDGVNSEQNSLARSCFWWGAAQRQAAGVCRGLCWHTGLAADCLVMEWGLQLNVVWLCCIDLSNVL